MKQHFTSALSQGFGRFASKEHGTKFQNFINTTYVRMMGLDMSEFKSPQSYASLNELFTRHFVTMRSFSKEPHALISPCDSLITEWGMIEDTRALQIKGMSYDVNAFLGEYISDSSRAAIRDGSFVNFYLSPRDYHRYHIPLDMQVVKAVHIPGKLYPVNIPTLKNKADLFIENERVVLECLSTQGKRFFLVLVGALNVGQMEVAFEPKIQTNTTLTPSVYEYENLRLAKGDDFGCFKMGSTIVMICEKEMCEWNIQTGQSVRFGQTIAKVI
ncbi:MAG: phosphatidylserine decarboxylase [Sulfuricurvum sp.]|jgi:phosphatidylserine decarboxylase|nr:phosphatidylserine decarboxylase [Sulfuricurvum sp.]MDP3021715.1 phosphatidylserine decarboxylase [Sulfuricurvum sp.]MDP3120086.1 phosphatidylserine decarboxylase [Sulfuricurvum sp.]